MDATPHTDKSYLLAIQHTPETPPSPDGNRRRIDRRALSHLPMFDIEQIPSPAYCCDRSGAVVAHNHAAVELWGRAPNPTHLFQWSGAVAICGLDGESLPRSSYPCAQAAAAGKDVDLPDLLIERPDGQYRRVAAHARPLRDPASGALGGTFCMLDDLEERDQLAHEIRRRDDSKDAFLSLLAHELRNPLAPILTAACVMRQSSSDGRILHMADMVERQVKQLSRFVSDLLDASNLAQDGISIVKRAVPLLGVLDCAIDELLPKAQTRKQRVAVHFDDRGTTVICDPERTAQALANVMLNASAFTGDEGHISIKATVEGEWLTVAVKDNGIGIDSAHMGQLFNPYSQFATHAGRLRAGVGLGLAITKEICERHGGHISAASEGAGKGSRFTIVLPVVGTTG
ncbi:ATP-binding protein [Massilia sp. TWP1-3-3]|uniref:sensor histidine kinase n=1 Tax=Massilia sp. TWP1-3-3 TaxID=2804573 RepID=UPI003CEE5CD1